MQSGKEFRLAVLDERQQLGSSGSLHGIRHARRPISIGHKGSTQLRGGEAIHWRLEGVKEPCGAVVIAHVPGAALRCTWKFEDSGIRATRITQQARIEGERAQDYVSTAAPEREKGIPLGMQKLPATMEEVALGSALGRWLCLF